MKISEWQKEVDEWIHNHGVRYFEVKTNTLLLTEEVGEFTRLIARKYGEQSFKHEISNEEVKNKIAEEMSDILFVLTCLANQMDIDLTHELRRNILKKTRRDAQRHLKNEKLK